MKRFLIVCVMVGVLSSSAALLLAHHSFAAEFDDKQPLKLTGTLIGKCGIANVSIHFT